MALTPKQTRFVQEYLLDFNASRAALAAGYSPKTAPFTGAENLKKPQIVNAIQTAQNERAVRCEVDADYVLRGLLEVHKVAFAEGDYSNSLRALELLGKHLGIFVDRAQQTTDINITVTRNVPALPPPRCDDEDDAIELPALAAGGAG